MKAYPKIIVLPDTIKAGDYAWNPKTGDIKLVVEANARELTVSGSMKWESVANWRPTDYPDTRLTAELIEKFNVNGW